MPRITIQNVPDWPFRRLEEAARENNRGLNEEAIACLEKALLAPPIISVANQLEKIRKLRQSLRTKHFIANEILEATKPGQLDR
jgi:hypothetical protein